MPEIATAMLLVVDEMCTEALRNPRGSQTPSIPVAKRRIMSPVVGRGNRARILEGMQDRVARKGGDAFDTASDCEGDCGGYGRRVLSGIR